MLCIAIMGPLHCHCTLYIHARDVCTQHFDKYIVLHSCTVHILIYTTILTYTQSRQSSYGLILSRTKVACVNTAYMYSKTYPKQSSLALLITSYTHTLYDEHVTKNYTHKHTRDNSNTHTWEYKHTHTHTHTHNRKK